MAATVEYVAEEPPRMQQIGEATPALPLPTCGPRGPRSWKAPVIPFAQNPRKSRLKKQPDCWTFCSRLYQCPGVSAQSTGLRPQDTGLPGACGGSPKSIVLSQVLQGT